MATPFSYTPSKSQGATPFDMNAQAAPQLGTLPKPQSAVGEALGNTMNDYANAGSNFMNAQQQGVSNYNSPQMGVKQLLGPSESALGATASGINTIFSPITNAIKSASDNFAQGANDPTNKNRKLYDNPVVSKILDFFGNATGGLDKWAQSHPEAAQNLNNAITVGGTAIAGGEKGLDKPIGSFKGIVSGTKELGGDIVDTSKGVKQSISNTLKTKGVNKTIENTMPMQSKSVRIDELRNSYPDSGVGKGGVKREGILGKSKPQPSASDIQRGRVANEYIQGEKDPIKQIQKVNQGIKESSSQTDTFLDKNSSHANHEDMRQYLESNNKPPVNIQKDPTAFESYKRSTENAQNTIYQTMKETANKTGDFEGATPGSDIRRARIAVDAQITRELGEETFGTPQYKGIKAAEINARNIINRMSEDMLRYPGQLEQLNKYNEFIDTMKSRSPDIKIDPAYEAELKSKFGLRSTPESEMNARTLSDQHSRMSHLYDARDNLIDNYQSNVGKGNKFTEFSKKHPNITKVGGSLISIEGLRKLVTGSF